MSSVDTQCHGYFGLFVIYAILTLLYQLLPNSDLYPLSHYIQYHQPYLCGIKIGI